MRNLNPHLLRNSSRRSSSSGNELLISFGKVWEGVLTGPKLFSGPRGLSVGVSAVLSGHSKGLGWM